VFMHGAFLRQALLLSRKSHAEQLEHRHTQFIKVCLVLGLFNTLFAFSIAGAAPGTPAIAAGMILLLTPSARARQLTSNMPCLAAGLLLLRVVQDLLAFYWASGGGNLSLSCELFTGRLQAPDVCLNQHMRCLKHPSAPCRWYRVWPRCCTDLRFVAPHDINWHLQLARH
jgi:hypothetical protein